MRLEIDVALARSLVASQFPRWADLPIAPVALDGWDNRTFRLGDELSIRLPTGAWYARQVEKEQRWLPVLAPQLPLPIPQPVARGEPSDEFPYPWSVYRWLEGEVAAVAPVADPVAFAVDLAALPRALRRVDATGGPEPGEHNFFRGGPPSYYEAETLAAIERLGDAIPRRGRRARLGRGRGTAWDRDPVWFHGDVASGTCSCATAAWRRCSTSGPRASAIRRATS